MLESPAKKTGEAEACSPPWDSDLHDYRLVLVCVFDSVVSLCTCETNPTLRGTSFFKDSMAAILGEWSLMFLPAGSRMILETLDQGLVKLQDKCSESPIYLPGTFPTLFPLGSLDWEPDPGFRSQTDGRGWLSTAPKLKVIQTLMALEAETLGGH